jgi:hypothetical protein
MNRIVAAGFDLPAVLYSVSTLRVVRPWLDDFMRGGAGYTTNLYPAPRNVDSLAAAGAKVIVHVRDPRQVLMSGIGHSRLYTRELRPSDRRRFDVGPREQVEAAIDEVFTHAVTWIDGWVKARGRLDVHFVTFENFVHDRDAYVDRLLALYGGDTRYFNRESALGQSSSVDFHRRSGEIDEWRRVLDAAQTRRVNARMPEEFWSVFGWSP